LDVSTAERVAVDARRVAVEARADAGALRESWVEFAGGEGRLVRPNDVTMAAVLADELDSARLAPMRQRAERVEVAAQRARQRVLQADIRVAEYRGDDGAATRLRRELWDVEHPVRREPVQPPTVRRVLLQVPDRVVQRRL
jgi:hypothetical protein